MLCIGMFGVGVGHALHADPGRPAAAHVSVGACRRQHPARADRSGAAQAVGHRACSAAWRWESPAASARRRSALLGAIDLSTSTFGAGMIVGARIGIAAIVGGLVGWAMIPYFVSIGWLKPGEPFRKDHVPDRARNDHGRGAHRRLADPLPRVSARRESARAQSRSSRKTGSAPTSRMLVVWVVFWGIGIVVTGSQVLHQPVGYLVFAVLLVFVFAMVNGISVGMVDSESHFLRVRRHRDPDGCDRAAAIRRSA